MKKILYRCEPKFYFIKMECKGVLMTRACTHDVMSLRIWFLIAGNTIPLYHEVN